MGGTWKAAVAAIRIPHICHLPQRGPPKTLDLWSAANYAPPGAPRARRAPGALKNLEFSAGGDRRPFAARRAVMIPLQPPGTKILRNRQKKLVQKNKKKRHHRAEAPPEGSTGFSERRGPGGPGALPAAADRGSAGFPAALLLCAPSSVRSAS
jgi:hypothetical protein